MLFRVHPTPSFRTFFCRLSAALALTTFLAIPAYAADQQDADESAPPQPHLTLRERVVETSLSWIGIPYAWGGESPESGFDCSGLVHFVFQQTLGIDLPRIARQQRNSGKAVQRAQMKPGDLVFFNTRHNPGSHVGIYIGDGKFLHAPSRGSQVRVDSMESSYWARRFSGARRLITGKTPH